MSTILRFLGTVLGFWVFNGGLVEKRTHLRHEMSAYVRKSAPSVRRTAVYVRKKLLVVSETVEYLLRKAPPLANIYQN